MAVGSSAKLAIRDITNEIGNFDLPSYQIDAANLSTWLTGWDAFKVATDNLIVGVMADEMVRLYDTDLSPALPTNGFAQREIKLLVRFKGDTTGDEFRRSLPCPDLAAVTYASGPGGNTDFLVLNDNGPVEAWVSAFEAIARNPNDDAETVTVTSIQVIGVNS